MKRLLMVLLSSLLVAKPDILSACAEDGISFEEHLVMDNFTYSYGVASADLDGDGDLDLTGADALPNNHLYWFENNGRGNSENTSFKMKIRSDWSDTPSVISITTDIPML